jgi:hypothetical protein
MVSVINKMQSSLSRRGYTPITSFVAYVGCALSFKMIKLIDTKNEIVDSVSMSYEDSFTLDTFQDMIQESHKLDKSFILARVSTIDPKQPDKCFYSYYDAFQLNKVLFQTQIIKGKKFIHRLHVLNPLSNLDIVGDVLYFHVKPKIKKTHSDQDGDIVPSESAIKTDTKTYAQWTLAGPISSPLTEDFPDENIKTSTGRAFTYPVVRPEAMVQIKENMTINMIPVDGTHAISPQKLEAFASCIQERKISIIPKGALTRYTSPISELQPDSDRGNRRAFSWMNTNNCLKNQLNFEEWKFAAKKANAEEEKVEKKLKESEAATSTTIETEYEALLFATDNDFLESVKTRKFFRENAVSTQDNKLFEMPAVEEIANMNLTLNDIRGNDCF